MSKAHSWHCDICGDSASVKDWRDLPVRHCVQCNMDRPVETWQEKEATQCTTGNQARSTHRV